MAGEAHGYSQVALTSRVSQCIDKVIESESVSESFKSDLKDAKRLWEEGAEDERIVSFAFIRSLHEAYCRHAASSPDSGDAPKLYLHELLDGCDVVLPTLPKPKRNPELEARIAKLKLEQEEREYQKMVENVSLEKKNREQIQLGIDMKSTQQQMAVVFNFILTVLGGFVFGYFAGRWLLGWQFTASMILGTSVATAIFYADLYFIVKTPHYLETKLDLVDRSPKSADSTQKSHDRSQKSHDRSLTSHDRSEKSADTTQASRDRSNRSVEASLKKRK